MCEWICETQCNLGSGCIGTIKFLSLPSSMRTIIQSTESRLAEYFGSVSLFAHVTGETESAHPFLSTHLLRRMSSDREHECERCDGRHISNVRHTELPCKFLDTALTWSHPPWFWLQQHGLDFMRDSPGWVFPCTKQIKKNMHLFHACHRQSVATQPSGSCRRTLNVSFIPCTNGAGALNFNLDPWLRLPSMSVIASTPTTIKIQIVVG